MTLRPSRKQSQRQPVIALAVGSFPRRQGYRLRDGWLFITMQRIRNLKLAAFYFVRGVLKIATAYGLRTVVKMEAIK